MTMNGAEMEQLPRAAQRTLYRQFGDERGAPVWILTQLKASVACEHSRAAHIGVELLGNSSCSTSNTLRMV